MIVQDIVERVAVLYNDTGYDRVSQDMYLKFLDDAINQLILARPDAHSKTVVLELDPGSRQALPDDAIALIDIYRNRGSHGVTYGSPIFQVNRKDLDAFSDWHVGADDDPTEITEFAYDLKSPKTFWVSPAVGDVIKITVEMDYSYPATAYSGTVWATALAEDVPVDEVFRGPLVDYMLYLLYSTDAASQNDRLVAEKYKSDFYNALGLEYKASIVITPTPGNYVATTLGSSTNG